MPELMLGAHVVSEGLYVSMIGKPGPKGSMQAWCVTCQRARRKQHIAMTEQSENGKHARTVIAGLAKRAWAGRDPLTGPVEVIASVYIKRRMQIKNGLPTGLPVPSESGPYPVHRNSGDIEKHVRTVHDALQDAGVLADDSQVVRLHAYKHWARNGDEGVHIEVIKIKEN